MFPLTHLMTFSYSKDWNRTMDFPSQICSWVCLGSQTKSQRFCHHSKQSHHPHSCWSRNLGMICESFFFLASCHFTSIHQQVMSTRTSETHPESVCLSLSAPTPQVRSILSAGWLTQAFYWFYWSLFLLLLSIIHLPQNNPNDLLKMLSQILLYPQLKILE